MPVSDIAGARVVVPSVGQRLLWLMNHYRGGGGALNCPVLCALRGRLDRTALTGALQRLAVRHDALRTTFVARGRTFYPVVYERRELTVREVATDDFASALAAELGTAIDPTVSPVRVTLWRVRDDEHVLCLNLHHLVTDAWSCAILFRDLRLLSDGGALPDIGWQYWQFAEWQQSYLAAAEARPHREYWSRQLSGLKMPPLPAGAPSATRVTERQATDIDAAAIGALRELARARRTTLFNVMLAVYYALLARVTGATDLAVASLFANRLRPEVQHTVGFVANMLILRTRLPRFATFEDLVQESHATVRGAFLHQALPYQLLTGLVATSGEGRADDVVFQMMSEGVYSTTIGAVAAEALVPEGVGNRFELELALVPTQSACRAVLFYNAARFDRAWARTFLQDYTRLAAAVAADSAVSLRRLAV